MKPTYLLIILFSLFLLNCAHKSGCRDPKATNYDTAADKDCNNCCQYKPASSGSGGTVVAGTVLFWTNDPYLINNCFDVVIKISNGSEVKVTGSFASAPASCAATNGGYISLPPGDYTYEVSTRNCKHQGGKITVTANQCNLKQI